LTLGLARQTNKHLALRGWPDGVCCTGSTGLADLLRIRDVRNIGMPEVGTGATTTFNAIVLNQAASLPFS
jgi:hypothetical protein